MTEAANDTKQQVCTYHVWEAAVYNEERRGGFVAAWAPICPTCFEIGGYSEFRLSWWAGGGAA